MFTFFNLANRTLLRIAPAHDMKKIPVDVFEKSIAVMPFNDVEAARPVLRRTLTFVGEVDTPKFFSIRDKNICQNHYDLLDETNADLVKIEHIISLT